MTIEETIAREEIAQRMRDALVGVLAETGILLRPDEWSKWRPTERTRGAIAGMPVAVTCVATDGNLGIFLPLADSGHNLGSAFVGHVHRFTWGEGETGAPPPLFSLATSQTKAKPKARAKKPSRKDILNSL